MTKEQIEIAARRLCELRGIDPDELVSHGADPLPDGSVPCVLLYSPAWTRAAREIINHWHLTEAINAALETAAKTKSDADPADMEKT